MKTNIAQVLCTTTFAISMAALAHCGLQVRDNANSSPSPAVSGNSPVVATPSIYTNDPGVTSYRPTGTVPGVDYGYIEYLPAGFNGAEGSTYPLIIFLHGAGEFGAGDIPGLEYLRGASYSAGVQYNIDHGKYYNAVVLSPQCDPNISPSTWDNDRLNQLIDYAVAHYKIDPKRILFTGLSMGGAGSYDYAFSNPTRVAAILPVAAFTGCTNGSYQSAVDNHVKVWSVNGKSDGVTKIDYAYSCDYRFGLAYNAVNTIDQVYDSSIANIQTAHVDGESRKWNFESQLDCKDPSGDDWSNQMCQTFITNVDTYTWHNVYQEANDVPLKWLLAQTR